jgi:hypothetical protein
VSARADGPRLPSIAQVNQATARTSAVLGNPDATMLDLYRAAEAEAATIDAYQHTVRWQADLDCPEAWARAGLDARQDGLEPEPEAGL